MIKKICIKCNKEYKTYLSKNKKFCSRKCKDKAYSKEKATNWKGGKIIKQCLICHKEFRDYPSNKRKYCSKKCCNLSIKDKNHHNWKGGKTKQICLYCNKEFEARLCPSYVKNGRGKFCSNKCRGKGRSGKNSHLWQGGISKLPYPFEFDEQLKENIQQRDNYKCQLCGVPQRECIKKLSIHHIDYNKQNLSEVNLITLCISCNVKANFNREYWEYYFTQLMISKISFIGVKK